jgi:hypothetical protein
MKSRARDDGNVGHDDDGVWGDTGMAETGVGGVGG